MSEFLMLLTALATALAAYATMRAAKAGEASAKTSERMINETRRSSRGQLVSDLYDVYWSDEFLGNVHILESWKDKYGAEYLEQFKKCRFNKHHATDKEISEYESLDSARRHIKKYFRKAHQLREVGYITDYDINNVLCPKHRVNILLESIENYEPIMDENYIKDMYDYYREQIG